MVTVNTRPCCIVQFLRVSSRRARCLVLAAPSALYVASLTLVGSSPLSFLLLTRISSIGQGFGARVARSVENFEHVMRLEEMARQRMSRRAMQEEDISAAGGGGTDDSKQGHHLRDLIISEAADWQVLTLYLAVHMQKLRSAISNGADNASQLARDALEIHAPLAHRLGVHHLSGGLEDLAFEALYPREYDEIRRSTQARMGVYQEVMETAKSAVAAALRKDKAFTSQVRAATCRSGPCFWKHEQIEEERGQGRSPTPTASVPPLPPHDTGVNRGAFFSGDIEIDVEIHERRQAPLWV